MDTVKTFVSYSWTSPEHEDWVLRFATQLRENGIDVILDKWDLREGHDSLAFMERMVTDSSVLKVIMIFDKKYCEKSNMREGGAGTEAQIIGPELYNRVDQSKFVGIIAEKDLDGTPYIPVYYKSRKYIDLSDNESYAQNLEAVIRWIFDKPFFKVQRIYIF